MRDFLVDLEYISWNTHTNTNQKDSSYVTSPSEKVVLVKVELDLS